MRTNCGRAPRGTGRKVMLARRLRQETTMSLKWIAERLQMGTWTYVSNLLNEPPETQPQAQEVLPLCLQTRRPHPPINYSVGLMVGSFNSKGFSIRQNGKCRTLRVAMVSPYGQSARPAKPGSSNLGRLLLPQ